MKVWIDQGLCNGDHLCEEICPELFEIHDDALAYVRLDRNREFGHAAVGSKRDQFLTRAIDNIVEVPEDLEEVVLEAAKECRGECIIIEF
jgi:ferredoxin